MIGQPNFLQYSSQMPSPRKETTSQEDYLERIHELIESKGYARVSDIAEELGISRPSVTSMIQQLSRLGYVNYEKYRGLTLTTKGKKVAEHIKARHILLTEFLTQLGLSKKIVDRDVEGIEHHLSDATLQKITKLVEHLNKHPMK